MLGMDQQQKQSSPHSWASGPPESKQESWNFERRSELLNISSVVLQAQVMGAMRRSSESEAWQDRDGLPGVDAKLAVKLAKELIDEVEKLQPKL